MCTSAVSFCHEISNLDQRTVYSTSRTTGLGSRGAVQLQLQHAYLFLYDRQAVVVVLGVRWIT